MATTASAASATGAASSSACSRARTTTPAATMVAAWMSAETGVGPSMASGSQPWNGNWADLPITPTTSSSAARVAVPVPISSTCGDDATDLAGAGGGVEHDDPEHERDVADPGDQERLHRRTACRRALAVVADQQVRADAHDLPPDQHEEQVVGLHHEQHRRGEQRHGGRVRRVPGGGGVRVVRRAAQVPRGVHLHPEGDERDRHGHQAAEAVDAQVERRGARCRSRCRPGRGTARR